MIRRLIARLRRIGTTADPLAGLDIGPGTVCARESLDGLVPQLVTIGRDCVIAPRAMLLTHDAAILMLTGKYLIRPVRIGDRVYVGYGAIVLPGVSIGDDAVVGAGAVVTHDVAPGTVVAGVPARVIGTVAALAAKHDPSELVEPPYGRTYAPTPAQIRELQQVVLERLGRSDAGAG